VYYLNKNNVLSNSTEGMFVSMDELYNIDFLNGKQTSNGGAEFSNTKQRTKNMEVYRNRVKKPTADNFTWKDKLKNKFNPILQKNSQVTWLSIIY